MALGVYIHLTAAIVAVAHLAIWGGVYLSGQADDPPRRDWRPAAAVALAGLLSIALYGPVLDQLLGTLMKPMVRLSSDLKWTSPRWLVSEMIFGLARGVPGGIVGLALGGLVILAGIVDYARQSRALIGTLLLPPILLAVVILLARHNLWPRFFFFAAGFGALIAVRGLFAACRLVLPRRATSVATVVAVILALASATRVPAAWGPKQRYGAAWSYVEAERGPDDAVVTLLMSDAPYLDRSGVEEIYSDNLARLDNLEERHDRIWVIYSFPPTVQAVLPGIWERLQTDYRRAAAFPGSVRDGEVVVMVKG